MDQRSMFDMKGSWCWGLKKLRETTIISEHGLQGFKASLKKHYPTCPLTQKGGPRISIWASVQRHVRQGQKAFDDTISLCRELPKRLIPGFPTRAILPMFNVKRPDAFIYPKLVRASPLTKAQVQIAFYWHGFWPNFPNLTLLEYLQHRKCSKWDRWEVIIETFVGSFSHPNACLNICLRGNSSSLATEANASWIAGIQCVKASTPLQAVPQSSGNNP